MDTLDIASRLIVAVLVGVALGLNRDLHGRPTGVRTLGLVGLGSALIVLAVGGNDRKHSTSNHLIVPSASVESVKIFYRVRFPDTEGSKFDLRHTSQNDLSTCRKSRLSQTHCRYCNHITIEVRLYRYRSWSRYKLP